MNLDADILERPAPAAPPGPDPRIAAAERWLCMLDALAEIGVRFAKFIAHRIAPRPDGPKGPILVFRFLGKPIAAFERVARAVRLAVCLAMRIENEIDDLRAGRSPEPGAFVSDAPRAKAERLAALSKAVRKRAGHGDDDLETVLQEIADAVEHPERAERLINSIEADLREDAAFYRLLEGPAKDAIAAICADLGLKPDWGLWAEDGFPSPPGGAEEDWIAFFVPQGEGELAPPPERPPPLTPPRARVRDPHHVLDPPRRDLNAFLAAHGIQPLPPPPGQRSACTLPYFALRPPRGSPGLPKSL
jgi:hypothetical protein